MNEVVSRSQRDPLLAIYEIQPEKPAAPEQQVAQTEESVIFSGRTYRNNVATYDFSSFSEVLKTILEVVLDQPEVDFVLVTTANFLSVQLLPLEEDSYFTWEKLDELIFQSLYTRTKHSTPIHLIVVAS